MTEDNQKIDELKRYILTAEENLEAAKKALFDITGEQVGTSTGVSTQTPPNLKASSDGKVIEGIFNGENMIGPEGKVFPVPANYASKSKLVEGDRLKLTVAEDGSFIFKQIGPVERKNLVGPLVFEDNMYHVTADAKRYDILYASVTYHKAKPGDKVTIVVPADGNATWAVLENVIHDVAPTAVPPKDDLFGENNPVPANPPIGIPLPAEPASTAPLEPLESATAPSEPTTPVPAAPQISLAPEPLPDAPSTAVPPSVNNLGEVLPAATDTDNVADLEI